MKGKTSPVPAWRALRVIGERDGRRSGEALEAPFVGRDDEIRLLKDLFQATSRERRARLVSIIGPAGIGKSRLGWEFVKYLDGVIEDVWWHSGRSPAYGTGISFWALGEMVRGRCRPASRPTTRRRPGARSRRPSPSISPTPTSDAGSSAHSSSCSGSSPAWRPKELFGAWRTFFERLAESGPVIMVFEDFQHADTGLVDFVDHMMEWSRSVPDLRRHPGPPGPAREAAAVGSRQAQLHLGLSRAADDRRDAPVARGRRPGPAGVGARNDRGAGRRHAAVRRRDGPDADRRRGGSASRAGSAGRSATSTTVAVPETLTALIAVAPRRAWPLPNAPSRPTPRCSVRASPRRAWSAVSGIPETELEPVLRQLVRRELLTQDLDPAQSGTRPVLVRPGAHPRGRLQHPRAS